MVKVAKKRGSKLKAFLGVYQTLDSSEMATGGFIYLVGDPKLTSKDVIM